MYLLKGAHFNIEWQIYHYNGLKHKLIPCHYTAHEKKNATLALGVGG